MSSVSRFALALAVTTSLCVARASIAAPPASKGTGPTPTAARSAPTSNEQPEVLNDEAELRRIVGLSDAAKYEECVAELNRLLDPKGPRPLTEKSAIQTARLYHATCFIGMGKPELADAPLRAAILADLGMRPPDRLVFPGEVVDRFLRVQQEMQDEIRKAEKETVAKAVAEAAQRQKLENERWARMLLLERLAAQETIIERNRRWIAALPFGVGQFQNNDAALGYLFLSTEAVLGITALTALSVHTNIQTNADRTAAGSAVPGVNERLDAWHFVLTASSWAFVGVTAVGILEAQLSFVPEVRRVRKRPASELPRRAASFELRPSVSAGRGTLDLGITGRF
jgi:hypothetical protein